MSSTDGREFERSDVSFDSWGERCAAWLYRPARVEAGAEREGEGEEVPCVVMAHGWSGVREQGLDRFAERFAAAGLAVLVFDYRHFGASEGEPRQLLDVKRQLADWASAISYARSLEGLDSERVALWGSSFSGGHVLATAARDRRVAAVVSQAPYIDGAANLLFLGIGHSLRLSLEGVKDIVSSLTGSGPHMLKAAGPPGSPAVMTSPDAEPGLRAITPPDCSWANETAARVVLTVALYRPGKRVKNIHCPLLLCVCDEDAVTPPGPVLRAAQAAPRGELARYPIGHFDIYVGEGFERAVSDETKFLVRHLLGRAAAKRVAAALAPAR